MLERRLSKDEFIMLFTRLKEINEKLDIIIKTLRTPKSNQIPWRQTEGRPDLQYVPADEAPKLRDLMMRKGKGRDKRLNRGHYRYWFWNHKKTGEQMMKMCLYY